jgi:glycosyltransferase involved in cell wall biosynthesis
MPDPFVSIVIPSYNARAYVLGAIRSALTQTFSRSEVIVVDDGSTDGTRELLTPYVRDKKIRYVYQENRGLSGARNTGVRNSTGDYIAFLDADDLFTENKVERAVAFLGSHPGCDICYNDASHFWDGRPQELFKLNYTYYSGDEVLPNLIRGTYFIAPSTTVFRRSVFERFGYFDEKLRRSEDLEFFLRATSRGCRVCFFPEVLGKICLKPSGLQNFNSQPAMKIASLAVYERLNGEMDEAARRRYRMRHYLVIHRLRAALTCLAVGDRAKARGFVAGAFRDYRGGAPLGRVLGAALWLVPVRLLQSVLYRYQQARLHRAYRKV